MPFRPITEKLWDEYEDRMTIRSRLRKFGIPFLDETLMGVLPGDLVLLGAPPGVGKTQLCCNIGLANIEMGRRVHFIALEADDFEIERRIRYQVLARMFFSSEDRPRLGTRLSFDKWCLGEFTEKLATFEIAAQAEMQKYKNLHIHYKPNHFGLTELIEAVVGNADQSDLFIIDHAHYFDLEDENENRGMKLLAKTVRNLAIEEGRPIILVAHLRKRDKGNPDLVPDMDEFHGTSDLAKIATRVVTLAPGKPMKSGKYETFFRVPKNRLNGGSKYYIGRLIFNPELGSYEQTYRIGLATCNRTDGFEDLLPEDVPEWARSVVTPALGIGNNQVPAAKPFHAPVRHWQEDT